MFSSFSVIATLFGVCTSLGLGTMQINRGLNLLNSSIPVGTGGISFQQYLHESTFSVPDTQLYIIWAITAVATGSVLTGVNGLSIYMRMVRVVRIVYPHFIQGWNMEFGESLSSASAVAWP